MHKTLYTIILFGFLLNSCSFPTTKEAGIKYSTRPAFQVPKNIEWREVGLAKGLINIKEKMVKSVVAQTHWHFTNGKG